MTITKILLISLLMGGFAGSALAQTPGSPANTTNQLSVRLWALHTKTFHAPAAMVLQAYVRWQGQVPKAGDSVNIEFFANSKSIGSAKAVWHNTVRPHVTPGQATPMWIMPAGFNAARLTWNGIPAGNYSLAARATWTNGLSTVSAPVPLTVTSQ